MELFQVILALLVAQLLALLLDRIYVPSITAYILSGIILGPSILGIVTDVELDILVSFSLIFLMFYAGLNVDFKGLEGYIKEVLIMTFSGVGVTIGLTMVVMTYLNFDPMAALVVAIAVANTATEVVVVMLEYAGTVSDEFRRILVMASFLDDLLAIGFIALVKGSILGDPVSVAFEVGKLVVFIVSFLGAIYFIVRKMHRVIYPLIINWSYLLLLSSMILFGTVFLSMILEVGEIYGAYVAGLAISMLRLVKDPTLVYEVRVEELVSRMSTFLQFFLIPIFFIYVGARADVVLMFSATTALVLFLALTGKFIGAGLPFFVRKEFRLGSIMGVAMNVRGSLEPAVVLIALQHGIIGIDLFSAVVSVSLLTSALIPTAFKVITEYIEV